jgi:hypothetical protein
LYNSAPAEANADALDAFAASIRRLLDAGHSMGDIGRELGITRQAVLHLLQRAGEVR